MSDYIIRLHEVAMNLRIHGAWGLASIIEDMIRVEMENLCETE